MIEIKGCDGRVLYTAQSAADVRAALEEAVRVGANLGGANLGGANLSDANLRDANLSGANLSDANLSDANLRGANLRGANLSGANLSDANLRDANLSDAYLSGANLGGANLSGANLRGAYLSGAYLRGANLRDAKNAELAIAQTRIIPDAGPIIGWKKCRDGRIVQLRIPAKAKRSHASGRKCRSDRARVLAIFNSDGTPATEAVSLRDLSFRYVVGETVVPQVPFDDNPWNECASGIHWYITRLEAEAHF